MFAIGLCDLNVCLKGYFRRAPKGREEGGYVIKNLHSSSAGLGGVNPAKQSVESSAFCRRRSLCLGTCSVVGHELFFFTRAFNMISAISQDKDNQKQKGI
jgi:hypothetical protein